MIARGPDSDSTRAARYLDDALKYARGAGLPRIESDVAAVRSDIRFSQGELDSAAAAAREAIAIATRRGMRLRVIANLVRLGRIQSASGDRLNAKMILEDSYRRAREILYTPVAKDAHEALMENNY